MRLVSFDSNAINDGTNYESLIELDAHGLPLVDVVTARRQGAWPVMGGIKRDERRINLQVFIRGASVDTLRTQLFQWFDYEDETPKQLVVEDSGGGNDRFVMALCQGIFPDAIAPEICYHIVLVVDGDVRWREIGITTASVWSITATGQTKVIDNNGQDKAFPILKIEPTGARSSGGFTYKRFIRILWNEINSATNYPVDIVNNNFDTATLTTAKMQADGDDLRVYVDGIEVDRWLQDMDTATTQVWCNLGFQGDGLVRGITGAHDSSQTTVYINPIYDITDWPNSGIVLIESELITYSGKSNQQRILTGCTRGAKGSTAATHTGGNAIYWIQHDIWIYYGDSTLSAPSVDDDYKPAFLLNSTNVSWDYDNFGEKAGLRTGQWIKNPIYVPITFYTDDAGADAEPWAEIGLINSIGSGEWKVNNPCGISNVNFQNGEHKCTFKTALNAFIYSDNGLEYTIPDPASDNTWDTWNRNETISPVSDWVSLRLDPSDLQIYTSWVEAADVTLTIHNPPTTNMSSEQSNYTLSCFITNNNTGDAIEIDFDYALNEELEVNTDEKIVVFLDENSNQFNALDLIGGPRVNWLPLDIGNNTLQFDDVGTGNVTITVTWWERYYE